MHAAGLLLVQLSPKHDLALRKMLSSLVSRQFWRNIESLVTSGEPEPEPVKDPFNTSSFFFSTGSFLLARANPPPLENSRLFRSSFSVAKSARKSILNRPGRKERETVEGEGGPVTTKLPLL